MRREQTTLLCVDDDKAALSGWCLYLRNHGYKVMSADNGEEGLQIFATQPIDAVILDYRMPEVDGCSVSALMKRVKHEVPILLFTGASEVPAAMCESIDAYMEKGCQPRELLQRIDTLLRIDSAACA